MHTTTLWTVGVLATATRLSPSAPPKPSSAMALVPSLEQPLAVGGVGPGARHHPGAVLGADVAFVQLHDRVDGVGGDQALLGQQRLQGAGAQRHLRVRAGVVVVVPVLGAHSASSR